MNHLNFETLGIGTPFLKAIKELGFEKPTEIQEKTIPILLESQKDFIGQAQTGTGKTAAFGLPLLERIDIEDNSVQLLVLTPTRELALQVEKELKKLSQFTTIKTTCVYGGSSFEKQLKALKHDKPQVVVGTPGRVIDLINRKALNVNRSKYCVLDEADEMLNMGFFEDVEFILNKFNTQRQLIMFSATMPKAILNLIKKSFNEYEIVKIKKESLSNDDIEQKYFIVKEKLFSEAISRIIDSEDNVYGLIFCRTRLETKKVCEDLRAKGFLVEMLNGDMGQAEREAAMSSFKEKRVTLMVCTDVAARGIDVTQLTHVFNYGLPQDNESYVHRIGRTGRAGEKGKAYTIVSPKTAYVIKKIEKHINNKITYEQIPSINELKSKAIENWLGQANVILDRIEENPERFNKNHSYQLFKEYISDLEKEKLWQLLYLGTFRNTFRTYDRLGEINEKADDSKKGSIGRGRDGRRRSRSKNQGNKSKSQNTEKSKAKSKSKSSYKKRK